MKAKSNTRSRWYGIIAASLFTLGLAVMPSLSHATIFMIPVNISAQGTTNIFVGDTVQWVWADNSPHNIESVPFAPETFSSGQIIGIGSVFAFVFTVLGDTNYIDTIHTSYTGTISVADISEIPLPAALPLYGTGLVLMGLFGWWKRRRAKAV